MDTAGGRLLRAAAVAVITIGLSAVGHAAAGGPMPSAPGLLLLITLATVVGYPLCRGSITRIALVPLLALVQAALHPAFTLAAALPWDATVAAPAHVHGAGASSLTMLLHHLASGLVAAGAVLFADRVIAELVAERRWLPILALPAVEPFVATVLAATPTTRRHGRPAELVDQAPRRGPPTRTRIG